MDGGDEPSETAERDPQTFTEISRLAAMDKLLLSGDQAREDTAGDKQSI